MIHYCTHIILTHSFQDVTRNIVPCQLKPLQGLVAVQAVQQSSATQKPNVIPSQICTESKLSSW